MPHPLKNNSRKSTHVWARIAVLAFLLLLIYILFRSGAFQFFMDRERIKTFLESLGPVSFIGFIFIQTLQVVAAPIPGEVTGFLGGFLYGPVLGLLLSTVGLTLGSFINFWVSKTFGRPFIDRFVRKETVARYDYLLHHKGAFLVFLLFLIPGTPKDLLCYILGLGHLSVKEFLMITTTGRFAGTLLLTLGGNFIRQHQYYRFSALLAVTIVIIFLSMAYKDKLERVFRIWHIQERRRERKRRKKLSKKKATSEEERKPR